MNRLPAGSALPSEVLLHTRIQVGPKTFFVRLQNIFAVDEPRARKVQVALSDALPQGMTISSVTETDINGVTALEDSTRTRLQFRTCSAATGRDRLTPTPIPPSVINSQAFFVELSPMDIRSYLITTK
jgi:hypothetical protein